jgi:hypothetical protein
LWRINRVSIKMQIMLAGLAIWASVTGTLSLLMALARTPPGEAASNLSKWLEWVGIRHIPSWLRARAADRWVLRYGALMIALFLFVGGMSFDNWLRPIAAPSAPSSPSGTLRQVPQLQKPDDFTWNDSLYIERAFLAVPRPCTVKISPTTPQSVNQRNILAHIIRLNNSCEIVDDREDGAGMSLPRPDIDSNPPDPPKGLVIRWHDSYAPGQKLYEAFFGVFNVVEGHKCQMVAHPI